MRPDGIEAFVRGLGGHDGVLTHLQEFDERLTDGAVVFDDQNNGRRFSDHIEIIVLSDRQR